MDPENPDPEAIHQAAGILRRGGLVAFPTETVYGLGANLEDPQAIQELYEVKARPFSKPATLHIADLEAVAASGVSVSPLAKRLMSQFWPGPLTLILARADGSTLGFRMPKHPVALRLLTQARVPVVAPSANVSGAPPPTNARAVWDSFADRIDLILDAGPTAMGVESTILDLTAKPPKVLRAGALKTEIEKELWG